MAKKIRADQLLVEQGLAESREKAKRLVMAGVVSMQHGPRTEPVAKPGQQLAADTVLLVKETERFVSRGGYKLLTALEHFQVDVSGKVALDAGASTGGFTDCLLQFGAARVYAVDVGRGQLHEKLVQDPRVIGLEKVNLRLAEPGLLPESVDVLVADVSFISLTVILEACKQFLKPGAHILALVKPQFELGPGATVKGVVKDPARQEEAVEKVRIFAEERLGFQFLGSVPSKIKGPKGNQEYMLHFRHAG